MCFKDKKEIVPIALLLLMYALSAYLYPQLPDQIPTHWNAQGEIDDYSGKFSGSLLLPIVATFIYALFLIIPKIAVYRRNIVEFGDYYWGLKTVFMMFMASMHIVILLASLGFAGRIDLFVIVAVAALLYYVGYTLNHIKRNYFIGVRTPWTLADDRVWKKTHEFSAKAFKTFAVLSVLTLLFQPHTFKIYIALIILLILAVFLYSYLVYRKLNPNTEKPKSKKKKKRKSK